MTSQQIKNFLYLKRNFKKPLKRSRNGEKFVKFGHADNSDPDVDQSDWFKKEKLNRPIISRDGKHHFAWPPNVLKLNPDYKTHLNTKSH